MPAFIINATITCPKCGFQKQEAMPENACVQWLGVPELSHRPHARVRQVLRLLLRQFIQLST
jgi:hypothetical protein